MKSRIGKKKVFFLINSLERAGGERVMIELARQASAKKDVKIITLMDTVEYGCPVKHESLSSTKSPKAMYSMVLVYVSRLRKLLLDEKPDILISFFELSNVVNILATRGTGVRCAISVRATPSEVYTTGIYAKILNSAIKRYYPLADVIISNSKVTKEDLVKSYGLPRRKISVVYNAINIESTQKSAKEELGQEHSNIFKGSRVLINSGRLTEQKAQFNLVKIFAEVKKSVPNTKLVILGEGRLKEMIASAVKRFGVKGSVFFLGNQKNPFNFMANSEAFLFPSFFEGFPNALVEAMACGVPVIAADCKSGPREILAPQTSIFRHTKDVEMAEFGIITPLIRRGFSDELSPEEKLFAKATVKLLKSQALKARYSRRGIQRVRDFSSRKIAAEFLEIAERKNLRKGKN